MSVSVKLDNFSIKQICVSGQCFRMEDISETAGNDGEDVVEVIAFGKHLIVSQKGSDVVFDCTEDEYKSVWVPYFDLNTDYEKIIESVDSNDHYLVDAAKRAEGIRILNQDLWEMIISFIISQRNNIKRIRKTIDGLCRKYGEKLTSKDGTIYYDFPTPEALYNADIEDLRAFGVGYRDTYIKKAAEAVYLKEICLDEIEKMSFDEARAELLSLYGVGEKVADCICLFALHHLNSFPKDTHIFQVLDREYKDGFPFDMYKNVAGVIQQYMFYNELN